ncbi:MAG TPA: LCP family protein [Rugosimonospora sp.]|nr:LCP family protein [Rugosimonospora sp.]
MSASTPSSGRARVPGSGANPSGRAAVPGSQRTTPAPTRGSASTYGSGRAGTATPPPPSGPDRGTAYRRRGPRPRGGRIILVAFLALALLGGGGVFLYYKSLDNNVSRTDPFAAITGARPDRLAKGAQNILLLGSDSRDPDNKAKAGEWRTDTIILMHLTADHQKAVLVSIPRDTYVFVPQSPDDPNLGNTKAKINAAFAWGGLPLAIETVEGFTGVHIDHVMLIDFGGFQQVTDALGGVDMNIDQTITSIHPPYRTFKKGMNHLNGAEALDYIRQRYQFPDGDITRAKHQQQFLKALMDKATSTGTLTNPAKLNSFLQAVTKAVTVDKDLHLADLAYQFHNLKSSDLTFLTSPFTGFATIDGESVVQPDHDKASALYDAIAKDQVGPYITPSATASPNK